jgi:HNH endonuclease
MPSNKAEYMRNWYRKMLNDPILREKYKQRMHRNIVRKSEKFNDFIGNISCVRCGYNRCKRALHFHHIDPKTKEFTVSTNNSYRGTDALIQEMNKCICLCANCHMELEQGLWKLEQVSKKL